MKRKPTYNIITEDIVQIPNLSKILQKKYELIEYIFNRDYHGYLGESEEGHEMWNIDGTEFPINKEYEEILNQEVGVYRKLISHTPPTEEKDIKKYNLDLNYTNRIIDRYILRDIIKYLYEYNIQEI